MTIIGGLIGLLGRFAGQILNTTLGWATLLLFGKVPQNRQMLLLVIVFGSLVWVALVIGIALPPVGTLLVASVPLSNNVDPNWIRLSMLAGALAVPVAIGLAAAVVSQDTTSRGPAALISAGIRGYPFAVVLTLMLGLLAAVGIGRKVRALSKKWTDAHIPLMVKPGAYDAVLADVGEALDDAGLDVAPRNAGVLLSGPPKLLDKIAGRRGLGDLVPDKLKLLAGKDIEVLVYPSDLAVSGTKENVARARAALASRVSNAPAYLTTAKESQDLEDVLDKIRDDGRKSAPEQTIARLHEVDTRLATLAVPYEEWSVLYRLRLQLERDARAAMDHGEATLSPELGETSGTRRRAAAGDEGQSGGLPIPAQVAIGLGGAALVAVDVALQVADRRKSGNGRNGRH
jgi:hypothetical protein